MGCAELLSFFRQCSRLILRIKGRKSLQAIIEPISFERVCSLQEGTYTEGFRANRVFLNQLILILVVMTALYLMKCQRYHHTCVHVSQRN